MVFIICNKDLLGDGKILKDKKIKKFIYEIIEDKLSEKLT